ncbi:juvenile hormone epoxide hydrolase isoform X2 [Amyelois transitella]|uniref:juvenile hormone epoxide hydrolase isoform X2 n=1 Tax=Amyelois transitella TaxID=680683 RepID=UPI00298FD329|nr:juvenile hormone epoxide hydrolase isoform X2 [Amyelois transitella]
MGNRRDGMYMVKLFLPTLVIVIALICYVFFRPSPPLPDLDYHRWWGSKETRSRLDTNVIPFEVNFSEEMIQDLKWRLKNHQPFTPPLEGVAFEYGFNSDTLTDWLNYWADKYPFGERQKFFNKYPHFKTNIQGLDIHFIRVKPKVKPGVQIVPMLLCHGWPGSVREFYEAIPHLTATSEDRDFALELIIPSLPGFGFSDAAVRPGLSSVDVSVIFRNLMKRLGYDKFYFQGGDWGAFVGSAMATIFPEEVLGYHTNMVFSTSPLISFLTAIGSIYPPLVVEEKYADRLYPFFSKFLPNVLQETGYLHLQATKPDTVGVSLTDSPAGLLAYILEKFSTYTRLDHRSLPDGGLEKFFTKDQLIDNLMLYWTTNSITTSMRLYAESFNKRIVDMKLDEIPSQVPAWALQARHEMSFLPPWMIKFKFPNLLNATILDYGGHFLALEQPEVFAKDVLEAVKAFREYRKKV